jgi:enamine deaminase RidA (YjgF/YER057c/UK114 family)
MPIRYFLTICFIACGLFLTGCPSPEEPTVKMMTEGRASNCSIEYYSMDAPSGSSRAVVVKGKSLARTSQLFPLNDEGLLVGEGDVDAQITHLLDNLEAVLKEAGSELDQLVKLNVYVDTPGTVESLLATLDETLSDGLRPAVTSVVTPLPVEGALLAIDAVAAVDDAVSMGKVELHQCLDVSRLDDDLADVSVGPWGRLIYFSGQPDKTQPRSEATNNSLTALLETAEQLDVEKSQILQLKVYIDDPLKADEVLDVINQHFTDQSIPPVVFVKWTASAPIEIEMIAHLPVEGMCMASGQLMFYTPPGVEPSPKFSRVALVQADLIYIGGLTAQESGDGETQVRDVFSQLESILNETGGDMTHLAKATYYVTDSEASDALGLLRPEYYDPARPPAASLVRVDGVVPSDRTVTMDMIAVPGK